MLMVARVMAKRIVIISGLVVAAMLAGLLGATLLGGPFISRGSADSRALTERYALGRDVYSEQDYAVETKYVPYHPGEKRIASPTVRGARAIEPYQAARPDHRIAFDTADGNFLDATDLPNSDYAMIDPPARPKPKRTPRVASDEAAPQNLLPGYIRTERPTRAVKVTEPVVRDENDPVSATERRIIGIVANQARPADDDPQPGASVQSESSAPR